MITEEVITEIYKNYNKPCKNREDLNLPYFSALLSPHHKLTIDDDEVIVDSIEEFSPFKRFLIRGLFAVLEFDRNVAFVFQSHIIFFSKKDDTMSVHFRPAKKQSLFDRIFGKDFE
ncbi:MAG: hypothetical protein HDS71_07010 [Bacteroidales bacterium]|nr:hypothetical protein [Bacteroidales bacterium]MBD5205107.1 hypothetical protein [Bacteroidales bacterium]MBD5223781.1 hypothetical protein [Bacteroidales bacterium]MBD5301804.1 hypothetical protein [Bacteroides sp.]